MASKAMLWNAVLVAAILSPVAASVAGATQQDPSSTDSSQQTPPKPDAAKQQDEIKKLPPGPGREELVRVCTGCHLLSVVTSQRKSEDGWTDTVVEMRNRGANASDDDMVKIVEYLAKNYGPNSAPPAAAAPATSTKVNVNTAAAAEIAAGLGLPQSQAQAIVDYRAKNGNFKNLAGLKQVPDIDTAKIDADKDKIEF
ncbi:MAG: helix-hairpin-helix domain-containing protein [Acidobacteriota bacterium]